jgi:hypothetical protein
MNVPPHSIKPLVLLLSIPTLAAMGCASGGPLAAFRSAELDDREVEKDSLPEEREPIRLVSFPSFDVLPLWPTKEEASQTSASIAAPFAAGADAVKRGAGQVKNGFVQIGHGTRRAFHTTTDYLSRPLVAVRGTPGEPSLLQRMFSSEPQREGPRTTREFFKQERVR